MSDLAQWIAIIVSILNTILIYLDKQAVKFFVKKKAISQESAININTLKAILQWRVRHNNHGGILQVGDSSLYYFDQTIFNAKKKLRRIRIIIILSLIILVVISSYLMNH